MKKTLLLASLAMMAAVITGCKEEKKSNIIITQIPKPTKPKATQKMGDYEQTMKVNWLLVVYGVILLLCLVSSAITLTFAFVDRFENSKVVDKVPTLFEKRCVLSAFIIILSVVISLGGLTNIIKYGYGYMGYLAIFLIIIPLLTVGVRKIRKG